MSSLLFFSTAFAQGAPAPAAAGGAPPALLQLIPFAFMIIVLYFLMIRPQAKKQKSQREFLSSLKRGDQVITSGGILGSIEGMTDQFITLEIAPGTRIKILRSQIASGATQLTNANSAAEVKST